MWFTVSDHKDTKFWNQFTTIPYHRQAMPYCFRSQRYKILKPIHNWLEDFLIVFLLFQITKIQNFETNSQQCHSWVSKTIYCFRSQRYKILKPIHNCCPQHCKLLDNCFRSQRYKILKPIHNRIGIKWWLIVLFQITKIQNFETNSQQLAKMLHIEITVSDHKDTKFWNQFTTNLQSSLQLSQLFQITKIQNFETNSQLIVGKFHKRLTVSDHKDTKFWNQFTTRFRVSSFRWRLFQITKIQNFETNSQMLCIPFLLRFNCFRSQRYKILKPIHNYFLMRTAWRLLFQITKIQNFETNSQPICP